jgi:choline dehydrogenase-like flavoprotein
VPHSGWPIGWKQLAPYYEKAATILGLRGLSPFTLEGHALPPASAAQLLKDDEIELKPFVWLDPPFRMEHYLRDAAAGSGGNLAVLTSARVRSLHERVGAPEIDYANVAAPDGRAIRVYARLFVLAAGGIGTPRILLNSTGRSPNGLGNDNDLVGRFLSTHPKADLGSIIVESSVATASPLFAKQPTGSCLLRLGLGLSAAAQEACRGLNHCVQITPPPKRDDSEQAPTIVDEDSLTDRGHGHGTARRGWHERISRAVGTTSTAREAKRTFVLRAFLDQLPNPDCRLLPAPEVDRYGDRKVRLSWHFSDDDRRTAREFFSRLGQAFARRRLGRVVLDPVLTDKTWPLTGIHSHLMGTTRMGDSPRTGVVDRDCRVFGCRNLYIAGPSTFPTSGYANPFLTIAALSLRLADHLKQIADAR